MSLGVILVLVRGALPGAVAFAFPAYAPAALLLCLTAALLASSWPPLVSLGNIRGALLGAVAAAFPACAPDVLPWLMAALVGSFWPPVSLGAIRSMVLGAVAFAFSAYAQAVFVLGFTVWLLGTTVWPPLVSLGVIRGALLGAVAFAFPACALAVFALGLPRADVADALALVFGLGLTGALSASFWPLPELRGWSRAQRVDSMALLFVRVSVCIHLTWELAWLAVHPWVRHWRDSPWAYMFWAYIDGGDWRYAEAPPGLVVMEALSVLNGLVGLCALRRGGDARLFTVMAAVHLYSTALYFGEEILAGMPNVNTARPFDVWVKFGLANAPWLVCPWGVLGMASRLSSGAADGSDRKRR